MFAGSLGTLNRVDHNELLNSNDDIVRIAKRIIFKAIELNASDIKIDSTSDGLIISFKVEGEMFTFTQIPKEISSYFINFIQRLSGLTVGNVENEEDSSFFLTQANCSFRVSQLHKVSGQIIIVLRLLKQDKIKSLDSLNIEDSFLKALRISLSKSEGLIILAGPTDSGKTTTICAAINELDSFKRNIISAEDPIEYYLKGVAQIQVSEKIGFDKLMRQFLRLNPDVIFLGEVRDSNSAHLCIEAARTGHLVVTTIHANSVDSIEKRFTEDFKVSLSNYREFLLLASSQRLVSKGDHRYPQFSFIEGVSG